MARGNPGKLVKWTNKDGQECLGIAYNKEQAPEFIKVKKVFVRHIDKSYQLLKDADGKRIVGLYAADKLNVIGYVD